MNAKILYCLCACMLLCGCGGTPELSFADPVPAVGTQSAAATEPVTEPAAPFDIAACLAAEKNPVLYYENGGSALIGSVTQEGWNVSVYDMRTGEQLAALHPDSLPHCRPEGFWFCRESRGGSGFFYHSDSDTPAMQSDALMVYGYDGSLLDTVSIAHLTDASCLDYDIAGRTLFYACYAAPMAQRPVRLYRQTAGAEPELLCSAPDALLAADTLCAAGDVLCISGVQTLSGGRTSACTGVLRLSGKTMQLRTKDDPQQRLFPYDGGVFGCDAGTASPGRYTGQVRFITADTDRDMLLDYPQESWGAVVSQSGRYVCTKLDGTAEDDSAVLRLSVYGADGSLLNKVQREFPAGARRSVEQMFLSESTQQAFFELIRSGGGREWVTVDFGGAP